MARSSDSEHDERRGRDKWKIASALGLAALACAVPLRAVLRVRHPVDDVYVTLTYARSLALGHGFRFFPSAPPSIGTTAPLYALLLSLPTWFSPKSDFGGAAVLLSGLAWIAKATVWFTEGETLGLSRWESFVVAAIAMAELPLFYLLGFEHEVFLLLATLALVSWAKGRLTTCGFLVSIASLLRPEGILLVPAFVAVELTGLDGGRPRSPSARWSQRGRAVATGLLPPLLLWCAYAKATVGQVLPLTLTAKIAQVTVLKSHEPFLVGLMATLRDGWPTLPIVHLGLLRISWWLPIGAIGFAVSLRKRPLLLPLAIWATLYSIGYGLLDVPFYPWYATGVQYVICVFASLALAAIPSIAAALPSFRWAPRVGLVLGAAALGLAAATVSQRSVPPRRLDGIRRDDYQALAKWLDANTQQTARIGFYEVGYLSYYSHRHIVDLLGLTEPAVVPALYQSPRDLEPAFRTANVDYWIDSVIMPNGTSIRQSEEFAAHFAPVAHIPGTGTTYDIYRRDRVERLPTRRLIEFGGDLQGEYWGEPETTLAGPRFRWMLGARATLLLPAFGGADSFIALRVLQEIRPGLANQLHFTIDGRTVAVRSGSAEATPPFVLCTEAFRNDPVTNGRHAVGLVIPETATPHDVDPELSDRRTLGLAVEWLKVLPAGEPCP